MSLPMLLILDLDETLVHATRELPGDLVIEGYFLHTRPGLDTFLDYALDTFDVGVWTSAGRGYASQVLEHILPDPGALAFFYAHEQCTRRYDPELQTSYWIKNLDRLKRRGHRLEQTLMVDDSPRKLERHYGNLIRIRGWEGDPADRELERLRLYLEELRAAPNVRVLEKRGWEARFPF